MAVVSEGKDRNIKVTFTADVSQYIAEIERARAATQMLLDLGIPKEDLPAALKAVRKIA